MSEMSKTNTSPKRVTGARARGREQPKNRGTPCFQHKLAQTWFLFVVVGFVSFVAVVIQWVCQITTLDPTASTEKLAT
jgi:hypothetical protein